MISLPSIVTPLESCGYLPDRTSRMTYEFVVEATPQEYEARLHIGWRRFGRAWFRPTCPECSACVPTRIDVARFSPDRSQRRNMRLHRGQTQVLFAEPEVTPMHLALYDRFHEFQRHNVGWRDHGPKDPNDYFDQFVDNPFPTEEWRYLRDGRLAAIGYVDVLPTSLSAIYFFHEPELRPLAMGTWNVLTCISEAMRRGLDYVYLGYFVAGCRSVEYKARFRPIDGMDWTNASWSEMKTG